MKHLKKFEKHEIYSDVYYELRAIDVNGDVYTPKEETDDANYNPYDLVEMTKLLLKKRKRYPNSYLLKITEEHVPEETIKEIKIDLEARKYNI